MNNSHFSRAAIDVRPRLVSIEHLDCIQPQPLSAEVANQNQTNQLAYQTTITVVLHVRRACPTVQLCVMVEDGRPNGAN